MEPNSSNQRLPRFRFSLAKLFIAVTVLAISFGVAGVPITICVAGVLAALVTFYATRKTNGLLAIFLFFVLWIATVIFVAICLGLFNLGSSL
jgi:hypothetical protein